MEHLDVAIIGGGPAGLSAALVLGRARRRAVVFDDGHYRNRAARRMHGFLTRDGSSPAELRAIARGELARYPSIELREVEVLDARRADAGFELDVAGGGRVRCRALLLATGLVDELPPIPGAAELLGDVVHHCPYCDGWEHRDRPLAVYSTPDDAGARYALEIAHWTRDVVFCPGGPALLTDAVAARLARRRIRVEERAIARLDRVDGGVGVVFADGEALIRQGLFFQLGCRTRGDLARRLGCELDARGGVKVNRFEATCVPRCYVAGDASRDVLQAVVAAGEGAAAAVMINQALLEDE